MCGIISKHYHIEIKQVGGGLAPAEYSIYFCSRNFSLVLGIEIVPEL